MWEINDSDFFKIHNFYRKKGRKKLLQDNYWTKKKSKYYL